MAVRVASKPRRELENYVILRIFERLKHLAA